MHYFTGSTNCYQVLTETMKSADDVLWVKAMLEGNMTEGSLRNFKINKEKYIKFRNMQVLY